jgi:hypothetical protein
MARTSVNVPPRSVPGQILPMTFSREQGNVPIAIVMPEAFEVILVGLIGDVVSEVNW